MLYVYVSLIVYEWTITQTNMKERKVYIPHTMGMKNVKK